jgi:uncharacterized protein with ParB-like and HNH nuclease domain
MGLNLSAEQKSIVKIFNSISVYIIPAYQRSYSWDIDKCSILWDDLEYTLEQSSTDGYFLGNIVIAKSDDSDELDVVDGQQRLITLTLLLKALSFFDKENDDIKESMLRQDRRDKTNTKQVIRSYVFEQNDNEYLKKYIKEEDAKKIIADNNKNIFATNFTFFYNKLEEFNKDKNISNFSDFLLDKVYMLPIVARGEDESTANEKALMIFETLNNRGMELSDADIFKSQLYNSALNDKKQNEFIKEWLELSEFCNEIDISIVDLFRSYMHIIRGETSDIGKEIGLRVFFTKVHPLKKKEYSLVSQDLYKIALTFQYNNLVYNNNEPNKKLVKWIQVLSEYKIQYVKYAIITYIYKNSTVDDDKLILSNEKELETYLIHLIRFSYFYGSTTKTKFKFYEIISLIMNGKEFKFKIPHAREYDYLGSLKNGYILLANYLDDNQDPIYPYKFDKILYQTDVKSLDINWKNKEYYNYGETIGNLLLLEFTKKRKDLLKRIDSYEKSIIIDTSKLSSQLNKWTYKDYRERHKVLIEKIKIFIEDNDAIYS